MLPPAMSTSSAIPPSMLQTTTCSGLSTSGSLENITSGLPSSDASKNIAYTIWIYMGPVIFFIGLIGNILILVVMSCKRMRGTSTSDYLIIMAVADLLTIITGMIPEWLEAMQIFVLQLWNPAMCKIYKFISYATGDTAIWIRVLFTLDRFMAICFPMKKTDCCLAYRAKYYCLGAALAAIAKNLHVFWTRGAEYGTKVVYEYVNCVPVPTNTTAKLTNCGYPTPAYRYFEIYVRPWIVFALVNLIPFCIILVCNVFIVRAMIQMTRVRKQQHLATKTSDWQLYQTTAMCLGASFAFLICVTPTMVMLIGKPYWTMNGTNMAYEIAKSVSNQLTYLNNSVNFFLYCITGKKFRETLALILRCHCKEVNSKSEVSMHAVNPRPTVRPYTVAAIVGAAGVNRTRGEHQVDRQDSKPDGYVSRQTSAQSVSFDFQSFSDGMDVDKLEGNVVVEEGRTTTVVENEVGISMEDAVLTQLVESGGETRIKGVGKASTHKRSESESSSGVSSSPSNGEPSPTSVSSIDHAAGDGYGSQQICCVSTNQSLKDNCHARDQCCKRDQCNKAVEHGGPESSCSTKEHGSSKEYCSTEKHCSTEEHCTTEHHCSSMNKNALGEWQNRTHALTSDHGPPKDRDLSSDRDTVITQNSHILNSDRTDTSATNRINATVCDSCGYSPTRSKSARNKTTSNVSLLNADKCEHQISNGSQENTSSQSSWEEQINDLEKAKDGECSLAGTICESGKCCGVRSHAESACASNLEKTTSQGQGIENTELKGKVVHVMDTHGIQRMYRKSELLDELPESIC